MVSHSFFIKVIGISDLIFLNGHIIVSKRFQIYHPLPWSAIHWNCLQLSHTISHSPNLSSQKAYIRFESNVHLKLSWDLSLSRSELDISSVHGIMGLSVLTSANYIHITFPAYSTSAKKTSKSIFHVDSSSWQIYHLISTLTHSQRLAMILFSRTHRTQKPNLVFLTITNTTFMSWASSSTRFQKWTTFPRHPSQYKLIQYVPAHIAMLKMPNSKTKLRDDKQTSSCFFRTFLNFPLYCPDTIIVAIISGSSQLHSVMYTVTMAEKNH